MTKKAVKTNYLLCIIIMNILILFLSILALYKSERDLLYLLKFITYAKYNIYIDGEISLFGIEIIENLQHNDGYLKMELIKEYFISNTAMVTMFIGILFNIMSCFHVRKKNK